MKYTLMFVLGVTVGLTIHSSKKKGKAKLYLIKRRA